jgi:hypothetical protein
MNRRLSRLGLILALSSLAPAPAPDVGKSYRVPYRLTDTNHFLVRVRINGKGPFNFLVDTGAPALYVSTETAKKVGLKPDDDAFWTPVERLDFEGGATLRDVQARVEDPFQLVGMNALGLPGASIDGILGFTMLARFRIELDPTRDRMTWTRLDYEPKDPVVPRKRPGDRPAPEMQAMNALGPLAKLAAVLIGKQPEEQRLPRGFLGLELSEGKAGAGPRVVRVLTGSPAAEAGVREGDRLVAVGDREVADLKAARAAVAEVRPGDRVRLWVRREGVADESLTVTAGEGL